MRNAGLFTILTVALFILLCLGSKAHSDSMGTAFTYQGRLIDSNELAGGLYDFQFKLFDSMVDGNQVNGDANIPDLDMTDGYFTVELDFNDPNAFNGNARWLQIGVRDNDPCDINAFTTLSPRQELTPTPYAIYAKSAGGDNDWMVSGNDMYSIPSGNVGIGTTTPGKKLDIASDSYTDLGIGLRTDTPGGTSWSINNDAGVFKIVEHASCGPEFGNNTRIAVVGNCIGSPYGGNIGIGTKTPNGALHIVRDWSGSYGALTLTGDKPTIRFDSTSFTPKWNIHYAWAGDFSIHYSTDGSNWKSRFVVKQGTGNVGIGTWFPTEVLDVNGTVKAVAFVGDGGGLTNVPGDSDWTISDSNMYSAVLGNVGIGTTDPNAKLEVAGDLKVTGAYRGDISSSSGSDGAPFPRPAYDSGWVSMNQDERKTLTHDIYGNVENYVVDMQFKSANAVIGINNGGYGGLWWGGGERGGHWYDLTDTTITIYRRINDEYIDKVRVRIWVYN